MNTFGESEKTVLKKQKAKKPTKKPSSVGLISVPNPGADGV